jgi:hypothetical protein
MEQKIIINTLLVFVIIYFLIGPGSRLFKKKSHHYIVPPASQTDSNSIHVEINSNLYNRYILTKNTSENYLLKDIKDYVTLSGNENHEVYRFGIAEKGDWKIIKIDSSLSFYEYHYLTSWIAGNEQSPARPDLTFGLCMNIADSQDDYLFYVDPFNESGDTLIGAFRRGNSFSINLSEANEENGNLTIKNRIQVSMNERLNYMLEQGLDISEVDSLKFSIHNIKIYK